MKYLVLAVLLSLMGPVATYGQSLEEGRLLLADDFARFKDQTPALGTVPGTRYAWVRRVPEKDGKPLDGVVFGAGGRVVVSYSSGNAPHDTGVAVEGFALADGVLSITVGPSMMAGRAHTAVASYRGTTPQAAAGGLEPGAYHVELAEDWSGSRDVLLRYGREVLAVADVAPTHAQDRSYRLRCAFAGDHHQVWVDDRLVIDCWEAAEGRTGAGAVGFGGFYSIGGFEGFSVAEARSVVHPAPPAGQMGPLLFRGRPFFALGSFDTPEEADTDEWLDAGGNTAIVPIWNPKEPLSERERQFRAQSAWGAAHKVALVYEPLFDPFSRVNGKAVVTLPEEVPAKTAALKEMLARTSKDPWCLGYWTFDEPENQVYDQYKDWAAKKDQGLGNWIGQGLKWTYDTLKAGHPGAYVMPTIAWWTTYQETAPLYDVNVPNQYEGHGPELLKDDLYNIVYDAAKAADAARAAGRAGFIYMPGTFDVMDPPVRGASIPEQRYSYFAPLTQGALGLLPWRLRRCTLEHRRAVVYPIMREVKRLIPWLLGEWRDDQVTSTGDQPTADYLKKLPTRVRILAVNEKSGEKVEVPGVPDCSHALRRRPDNSYLLLAVSNRKEPLAVTLTLKGIAGLPATAFETIQSYPVPIRDGTIITTFEPFGVRAYVIRPK